MSLLLKYMGHQIPLLWGKLPEYLRADSEVASYQTCHEHWNLPNCGDHIDGRASARRDCHECRRNLAQEIKYDNTKQSTFISLTSFTCKLELVFDPQVLRNSSMSLC